MKPFLSVIPPSEQSEPVQVVENPGPGSLRESVETALAHYFNQLDGQPATDLYQMVLQEIEAPLLTSVLQHTGNNQSKAAEMLGLNRGTLRKKLKQYDLL